MGRGKRFSLQEERKGLLRKRMRRKSVFRGSHVPREGKNCQKEKRTNLLEKKEELREVDSLAKKNLVLGGGCSEKRLGKRLERGKKRIWIKDQSRNG